MTPRLAKVADLTAKPLTEKEIQRQVVTLFRTFGTIVHTTSQYRASHIAKGLPDLICFHRDHRLAWWFETKKYRRVTAAGVPYKPFQPATWEPEPLRPEQQTFADLCLVCGQRHFWGGITEARQALVELGLAKWYGPTIERVRAA